MTWYCNIYPVTKATCDVISRNDRPYILFQFTVVIKTICRQMNCHLRGCGC